MEQITRFQKIAADGAVLPVDATQWEAVLDSKTGLMWTKDHKSVDNYGEVGGAVKSLQGAAGFDDWRAPTVEELFLLADRTKVSPAIDTDFFPECESDWYWTSTPYAPSPGDFAWSVNFSGGGSGWNVRDYSGLVRALRVGQ